MPKASRLLSRLFLFAALFVPLVLGGCADDDEDLTPPDITIDALPTSTLNSARVLSGTIDPGASIGFSADTDVVVGEDTNPADDLWEVEISDLRPGINSVLVFAQDEFNTRTLQLSLVYNLLEIDRLRTVTHLDFTTVSGRAAEGVTLSATLENPVGGVATYNSVEIVPTADPGSDDWSLLLDNLVLGTSTLRIEATDPAAGKTQTVARTITYDPQAVELSIDAPSPAGDDLVLSGTAEAGATVRASAGTTTYNTAVAVSDWSIQIDDLPEGQSVISVSASADGKTTAYGEERVEIDTFPVIVSVFPATPAPLDTTVSAVFDQAVVGSAVNEESFILHVGTVTGTPVTGTVTYDAAARKAIFTPEEPLEASTPYVAELTSTITDPAGNPIDPLAGLPAEWSFTTAGE